MTKQIAWGQPAKCGQDTGLEKCFRYATSELRYGGTVSETTADHAQFVNPVGGLRRVAHNLVGSCPTGPKEAIK